MKNILVMIIASLLIVSSLAVGISVMPRDTNDNKLNSMSCDVDVKKFLDSDEDGIWDMGEPGLVDWTFELYKYHAGWKYVESGTTDSNGELVFNGLDCYGHYKVRELIPPGWNCTTHEMENGEGEDYYAEESFWACQNAELYFGNVDGLFEQPGNLQTCKYYDHNMDGERDWEGEVCLEEGLGGWIIELWYEGEKIDEKMTPYDECGCVIFYNLAPGMYTIREIMQEGWLNTTPMEYEVEVVSGETTFAPEFGNIESGNVEVCKFYDVDANGTEDNDDYKLSDWEFELSGMGEERLGVTGVNGCYLFEDLWPGTYTITEVLPEGWFNTTPTQMTVEVGMGETETVTFGNAEYGEIRILKFNDLNMDGIYDEGTEPLIDDVFFSGSGEGSFFSGETVGGMLIFTNMMPGQYTINEDLPEGWTSTTPIEQICDLAPGAIETLEFGNVQYGHLRVCKYNDENSNGEYDEGEEMLSNWTFNLWNTTDESPDTIIDTNVTGPCGCAMFWNLEPGYYAVQEVLKEGWSSTTPLIQYVDITAGNTSELWFGNVHYGDLRVCKYNDENMNGTYDDEEMLEGWTFNLWTTEGNVTPGQRKPLDVVMMIDTSGSMSGTRMIDAKAAAIAFMDNLNEEDRMALYSFDGAEDSYLRRNYTYMTSDNKTTMESLINSLQATGGTPIWDSIGDSINYSQTPANQRGGDIVEMALVLTDGPDYYYQPEAGSEDFCAGSEPGTDNTTHTWGTSSGLKWGDAPIQFKDQNGVNNDVYTYDYGWVNLPSDGEYRTGLIHAPIPVYTVGLGISPHEEDPENPTIGDSYHFTNEYNLWRISETSGAKYFYAPDSEELGEIFEDIFGEATGGKQKIATNVTGPCGCTMFWDLEPGEYIVEEILQDCWQNTTPLEQTVEVVAGETTELWFGNYELGNIKVYKFEDTNMNGTYDEGEEMLSDWEFELWQDMTMLDTGVTNAEGYTMFECIDPGMYTVEEILPPNWENTTPLQQDVMVEPGMTTEIWFGNVQYGSILVCKYFDMDGDGMYDDGEEMLSNWTFNVWTTYENGTPKEILDTQMTGENGCYLWNYVPPGTYVVQEELQEGWCNTTELLQTVVVEPSHTSEVWFGNTMAGEISGMKYKDIMADGIFDVGVDEPLKDWVINLWTVDEFGDPKEIVQTTMTDRCGMYYFYDVCPGEYYVQEEVPDGWYNVTPALVQVVVEPGEIILDVDFANCMYKHIYGVKFYDYNMNGVYDEGTDWTLEGWEIQLWNHDQTEMIEFTYTLECGYYWFEGLEVGTYWVKEVVPEGWHNSTPSEYMFEITCCNSCKYFNFGNFELAEIQILKFNDLNMDGIYDEGTEPLVDDVFFSGNGGIFSGTTVGGMLIFSNMMPDYYTVTETLPDGWFNTTPMEQSFDLSPGETVILEFGNVQYGHLQVCKYYDANYNGEYDDGEEMLEDWTFNLWTTTGGSPDTIIDTNVTGPCGCTMFWNLEPGYYAVQEILPDCWMNTTSLIQYVDITAGETSELWFGNYELGHIMVHKFYDENLNGEYDDEEEMLENWTFNLYNDMDELIATDVTNEDGYIEFNCLEPGMYYVEEVMQSCWCNTTAMTQWIEVTDGETSELWFGNAECGSVYGYKFFDFNMNGEYDDEEDEPLEGWTIYLEIVTPPVVATTNAAMLWSTTTDEDGYYEFECVCPMGGTYTVYEELPEGWYNTTPAEYEFEMPCGEDMQFDFGNYRPSDIWGMKYCDVDRDGEFDTGLDKPLEGWQINLWSVDEVGEPDEILETTYTDNCGLYYFYDLLPGYYWVEEIMEPCGWYNVTPSLVNVRVGYEDVRVDFANWRHGEITVFKYYDENMNGVYDDGTDWPLEGWEINLWTVNETGAPDEIIATGYTCEEGYYIFPDLEPGKYAVQDVLPTGWASTTDPIQYVTVRCCCVWVEFGNYEEEVATIFYESSIVSINYNVGQNEIMCATIEKIH